MGNFDYQKATANELIEHAAAAKAEAKAWERKYHKLDESYRESAICDVHYERGMDALKEENEQLRQKIANTQAENELLKRPWDITICVGLKRYTATVIDISHCDQGMTVESEELNAALGGEV